MTGDRTPTGGLRERLAEALREAAYVCPGDGCPHDENTCGVGEPIVLAASTVIDGVPDAMLIDGEVTAIADAVLPVVQDETAALRQRIEEVEDQRDQALAWQDTAERELRNVERRLDAAERIAAALEAERDKARAAIADERRGRLAAEAAVRRVRQVLARKTLLAGPQAEKAVRVADVEAALDAEQPKESP